MGSMLLFLQIWMLYINVMEHVIQQSDHFLSKGGESKRRRSESQVPSGNVPPVIYGPPTSSHLCKVLCSSICTTLWPKC